MPFSRYWSSEWWKERIFPAAQRHAAEPRAEWLLLLIELAALLVFPIPVILAVVTLITAAPKKWWRFAASSMAGSSIASLLLFLIGRQLMDAVGYRMIAFYGLQSQWADITGRLSGESMISLVIVAGLTSGITRFVCLGAGFMGMNPLLFAGLTLGSRLLRSFAVCAAIRYLGQKAQTFPKRYYPATILLCLLALFAIIIFAFVQ